MRSLMELVYCLLYILTERKTKQPKTYASYRLVGLLQSGMFAFVVSLGKMLNGIASTFEWLDW